MEALACFKVLIHFLFELEDSSGDASIPLSRVPQTRQGGRKRRVTNSSSTSSRGVLNELDEVRYYS